MQILQNILLPGPKLLVTSEARGLSQRTHSTGATTSTFFKEDASYATNPFVSKDFSSSTNGAAISILLTLTGIQICSL